jgi:hypothetical protein
LGENPWRSLPDSECLQYCGNCEAMKQYVASVWEKSLAQPPDSG